MTQAAPILSIVPRDYDIFAGLDVDKKSMAVTFTDHGTMRKSLKLPYNAGHLLNYTRKHFPGQRVAFVYEAGPTGFCLHDELPGRQPSLFGGITLDGANSAGTTSEN